LDSAEPRQCCVWQKIQNVQVIFRRKGKKRLRGGALPMDAWPPHRFFEETIEKYGVFGNFSEIF
jgi:hypothetical protein